MIFESWNFGRDHGHVRAPEGVSGTSEESKYRPPAEPKRKGTSFAYGLRFRCKRGEHGQCNASKCSCDCHKVKP